MYIPLINEMLGSVTKVIDSLSSNSTEKQKLKTEVSNTIISHLDRLILTQKEIILTESQGNWLQRSWRPIVMMAFSAVVVLGVFFPIDILNSTSPFWNLIELGMGGYVLGRSAEKITNNITAINARKHAYRRSQTRRD